MKTQLIFHFNMSTVFKIKDLKKIAVGNKDTSYSYQIYFKKIPNFKGQPLELYEALAHMKKNLLLKQEKDFTRRATHYILKFSFQGFHFENGSPVIYTLTQTNTVEDIMRFAQDAVEEEMLKEVHNFKDFFLSFGYIQMLEDYQKTKEYPIPIEDKSGEKIVYPINITKKSASTTTNVSSINQPITSITSLDVNSISSLGTDCST